IQGYQGQGYSQEFEENMVKIIEKFQLNPDFPVKIIIDADVICEHCPHDFNGKCTATSDDEIRKMDSIILEKLQIKEGTIHNIKKLFAFTLNLNKRDVFDICGSCSWRNCCSWYERI
ncbi:MAG TPA: DUF1284 domain-containing protein, partial [Methanobacteriaceae archaeon]|nr:DUF1284 domain-containing protein [Methanobacteriaceae archaeon]